MSSSASLAGSRVTTYASKESYAARRESAPSCAMPTPTSRSSGTLPTFSWARRWTACLRRASDDQAGSTLPASAGGPDGAGCRRSSADPARWGARRTAPYRWHRRGALALRVVADWAEVGRFGGTCPHSTTAGFSPVQAKKVLDSHNSLRLGSGGSLGEQMPNKLTTEVKM